MCVCVCVYVCVCANTKLTHVFFFRCRCCSVARPDARPTPEIKTKLTTPNSPTCFFILLDVAAAPSPARTRGVPR